MNTTGKSMMDIRIMESNGGALFDEITRTGDSEQIPAEVIAERIRSIPAMDYQAFLYMIQFDLKHDAENATLSKKYDGKNHQYIETSTYNTIATFDTETTKDDTTEAEYMYIWQFCLNGYVCVGRTWREFLDLLKGIKALYNLNASNRMIVWVHNLGFDSALFMPRISETIEKVFSTDRHKPLYIKCSTGFTFRDSLIYSGYSLEKTAEQNVLLPVRKLAGDIDYTEKRNSKTPLTDKEWNYCINDVTALCAYIYEEINRYGDITKLPLTNTGKVREYLREKCLYKRTKKGERVRNTKYSKWIESLTIDGLDEYNDLKAAFSGGYTHASNIHSGITMNEVYSMDFSSSYPGVMVEYKYPSSSGMKVRYRNLAEYQEERQRGYWHIIALELWDVKDTPFPYEHYISAYKCVNYVRESDGFKLDNGRVISADHIRIICTDEDFDTISETYSFTKMRIAYAWRYHTDYIPKPIIEGLLEFYGNKTKLKGIPEKKTEYQHNKGMNNSIYGMMVQDPLSATVIYDTAENEYEFEDLDGADSIEAYNKSKRRFTFYPVGVAITSHARRNLWQSGIEKLGPDYIYADTDSVKYINPERHAKDFEDMNAHIKEMITETLTHYNLDPELAEPETIEGIKKPLGAWDYDGHYEKFKTIGAKRYMYIEKGKLHITIAGVNKKTGAEYLNKQTDPFEAFRFGLVIPKEYSGKTVIKYGSEPKTATITDKYGNTEEMHEQAQIYLTNSEYQMDSPEEYKKIISRNILLAGSAQGVDIARKIQSLKASTL